MGEAVTITMRVVSIEAETRTVAGEIKGCTVVLASSGFPSKEYELGGVPYPQARKLNIGDLVDITLDPEVGNE